MFIYIACVVGFFAIALIVGVSCKRFMAKRRGDKFRRPYDEPRPYRAGMSATGEDEEDDEWWNVKIINSTLNVGINLFVI